MNNQLKTILLTISTLSLFAIALVELSGVSKTAFINKYGSGTDTKPGNPAAPDRDKRMKDMPMTTIQFADSFYNFGTIKEGDIVKHEYKFRNVGTSPLFIARAEASCGCTVPSFPKEPLAPGEEGVITVQFNSSGRAGHQQKNVMVFSNAQQDRISIGFEAEVTED